MNCFNIVSFDIRVGIFLPDYLLNGILGNQELVFILIRSLFEFQNYNNASAPLGLDDQIYVTVTRFKVGFLFFNQGNSVNQKTVYKTVVVVFLWGVRGKVSYGTYLARILLRCSSVSAALPENRLLIKSAVWFFITGFLLKNP